MEEKDEDNCSSDNSAISENAEFSKLNIGNNSDDSKNNNSILKINLNQIDENGNVNENRKSYQSMFSFSVVSKNGENNNVLESDSVSNFSLNEKNSPSSDIRTSEITSNFSIWESIKQKLSNFKNQIIFNYNIFTGLKNLKFNSPGLPQEIQIFDENYLKQDNLINRLKNIPWFSYRKDFDQIKEKDNIYTSDAGWGCMLRASQMFLAQGIYQLFSIKDLQSFINDYIAYFYDNKIPIKLLNKSKNDNNDSKKMNDNCIKNQNEEESFEDFVIIDPIKECRMSFIEISMEMIKGLENMSERNTNKKYITSPFSIRNFIKIQKHINPNGKKVGEWFSNYDVAKIINEINRQMNENNDNDFKIINFSEGTIYIEDIFNKCFKEEEKISDFYGFENLSDSIFEKSEEHKNENKINNDLKNEYYIFDNKRFKLNHKFIIFVSVRHGLYTLEEEIYEDILNIFNIKTNIGLIGGRNSRAFYFIGKCDKNLLFLDPHYVQPTIPLNKFGTDSIHESYRPNDIYYMPINDLSPSFTIGFAIKDMKNFKIFMQKMNSPDFFIDPEKKTFSKKTNLFVVKSKHPHSKKNINQDIS